MLDPLPLNASAAERLAALNKVIEAVNVASIQRDDDLRAIWSNLNSLISKSSGLRPLHIEDGQVQEDVTLKAMWENQLRYQTPPHQAVVTSLTPSVPEAEPQEQETLNVKPPLVSVSYGQCAREGIARLERVIQEEEEFSELELAIFAYAAAVRAIDKEVTADSGPLVKAMDAILAAAHREYAQPQSIDPTPSGVKWAYKDEDGLHDHDGKVVYAQPGKGV